MVASGLSLLKNGRNTWLMRRRLSSGLGNQSQSHPAVHKVLDTLTMQILEFNSIGDPEISDVKMKIELTGSARTYRNTLLAY